MPIAKHRDNLSDLVDKAAKRRDRVNTRKRRLSSVHVSTPVDSEIIKLKQQRLQSKRVMFADSISESIDDESVGPYSPTGSQRGQPQVDVDEKMDPSVEMYIKLLARLSFLSTYVYIVVENTYWKVIRLFFICLAIYTLAGEVSLLEGHSWSMFFYVSNAMVNSFFLFDGLLKLWSFFGYLKIEERFSSKNTIYGSVRRCGIIDFTIASLCFYFASSKTGNWLKLVRVMFIALFGVQQLTSLDVLMSGIGFGLHSVFYTWLLLVLVFIVYGAAGVTFYAENDPYHFGTIAISMWTFFQISTMDDWIEVMLINSYGCDKYPVMYSDGPDYEEIDQWGHFYLPICVKPSQQRFVSIVLFFSFIVIVGFVLMSLTIAAVTAGINDRLDNLQKEELREELSGLNHGLSQDEKTASTKLAVTGRVSKSISNLLRNESQAAIDTHLSADPALLRLMLYQALNVKKKTDFNSVASAVGSLKKVRKLSKKGSNQALQVKPSAEVLRKVNSGDNQEVSPSAMPPPTNKDSEIDSKIVKIAEVNENASSRNTMSTSSNTLLGNPTVKLVVDHIRAIKEDLSIQQLSLSCRNLTSHKSYNIVINLFIIFGAGFELNSLQEDAFSMKGLDLPVNVALQIVFTFDIVVKVLATFPQYSNFWKKKWNRFDVCTVFLLWIAIVFNFRGLLGRVLELLRVLRIFRILKLISKIPELHVIMMSIASSVRALTYIVALMFIFFFHFAVAGIYMFQENDPFHFEGLVRAFTTLFQVATLDNWGGVARINMLGCNNTEYDLDPPCTNPQGLGWLAAWYFIMFIILGVMVLLSLFVGVIITSMELLKEGLKEEHEVLSKVRHLQYKYDISDSSVEHLLEIFDMIDVGSNGKLTLDELKPVLEIVSVTPVQQFEMFVQVDSDRSGQIDFSEFCELIQLIGQIYIDNEQKKGAKIIRRTKTSRRINIRANRARGGSGDRMKYADSASDAGSDVSHAVLMRGGSSGSLVPMNDWSLKDPTKAVHDFDDNDLDMPAADMERQKPHDERPRTKGGLWSMFDGANIVSPLESPRNKYETGHTQSGGLSPVPSALDLLSLRKAAGETADHHHIESHDHDAHHSKHSEQAYMPIHTRMVNAIAAQIRGDDDSNDEHHFQLRGHTASSKLKMLQGGSRPTSATPQRPSSATHRPPSAGPRRGSKEAVVPMPEKKSSEKAEPTLHSIPSSIELYDNHSKADFSEVNHRKLGDFSLADMSVHSMNNLENFTLFSEHGHDKSDKAKRREPAMDPVVQEKAKAALAPKGDLELSGVGSRKSSDLDARAHVVDHGDVLSPARYGELNAMSVGSEAEETWSVGGRDDPTLGLSGKRK